MLMTLYAATVDFTSAANNTTLAASEVSFVEWIIKILNGVLVISALLVLLYLLWGAISWITAAGDSNKIQAARDRMTQAIIGLVVLAGTLALFMLLQKFLGIEAFNFTGGTTYTPVSTGATGNAVVNSGGGGTTNALRRMFGDL